MKGSRHKPLRLGLLAPLSGLVAMYGPEISWAGQIACEEINESDGINGRPLELIILDDGSQPETAVPAAHRLIDEFGCCAIVGNLLSNSRIAVAGQVAEPRQTPYLNFSFYEGSIGGRYFFNFAALPNQQIEPMIPYMMRQYGYKMFFAGTNYEWPAGSIDAAKRVLTRHGGEVVGEEYRPFGHDDFNELLDSVVRSGCDVFVPYFAGADQVNLLNRFAARHLKTRMAVVMGHYDEAMVQQLAPQVREGLYSCNSYFMEVPGTANRDYLQRLARHPDVRGLWPKGNGVLTNFGEGTYVCVHAFAQAARQALAIHHEALIEALERVSVSAPQGQVVMDPTTHHAQINTYLARCRLDGSFSIIESFGRIPPHIPERYRPADDLPVTARPDSAQGSGDQLTVGVAVFNGRGSILHLNHALQDMLRSSSASALIRQGIGGLWVSDEDWQQALNSLETDGAWRGSLQARRLDDTAITLRVAIDRSVFGRQTSRLYTLTCWPQLPSRHAGPPDNTQRILSIADIAVVSCDASGNIVQANRHGCTLFGYQELELIGQPLNLLIPPSMRAKHDQYLEQFLTGNEDHVPMGRRSEVVGYRKDGTLFPAEVSISRFRGEHGWILVASLRDITQRKQDEAALLWQATHDPLTKLPNRALIRERLEGALARSRRSGDAIALLFIDLDGFKLINDSHGHDTGDKLLTSVAEHLLDTVRPGDTVARLGGDEFVVLCEQVDDLPAIGGLADRLNSVLREPLEIDGEKHVTTASIGLALGYGATDNPEDLLRDADAAMYMAKEQGRDRWHAFSQDLHEQAKRRLSVATGLRVALENAELQTRFQPIVAGDTGRIAGVELLLRWFPSGGEVSPALFVPIAEATGSILPIGRWVFEQACLARVELQRRFGSDAPYVSVNVSTRQLDDETLVEHFDTILRDSGAEPAGIVLELTETSLMSNLGYNLRLLQRLADLGLRVAVDDFGTGYSSLAQLLRLPLSILKIDREFIDGLDKREDSQVIVAAVNKMARSLGLSVIGEGVESEIQRELLWEMGCRFMQGYLFSRPIDLQALLNLLPQRRQLTRSLDPDLYFCIYTSVAGEPFSDDDLSRLLVNARGFNLRHGLTGMLLHLNGTFLQMLEGRREDVESLMRVIHQDPRHHSVREVMTGPAGRRLFLDWRMGFCDLGEQTLPGHPGKAQPRGGDLVDLGDDPRLAYHVLNAISQGMRAI